MVRTILREANFELMPSTCVVSKTIELYDEQFDMFMINYNQPQKFIADNLDSMFKDDNDMYHCLLVKDIDSGEGVLVYSEGKNYAQYTSYLGDSNMAFDKPSLGKALQKFVDTMMKVQRDVVQKALDDNHEGSINLSRDYIEKNYAGGYPINMYMLKEMLLECHEIESVNLDSDNLCITTDDRFANYPYSRLDESDYSELEIMAAKHTLWIYDEGGEQFNLEDIHAENMSFVGKCLNGAIIRNCTFKNCDFTDAEFCSADLSGTVFENCKLNNVVAEESNCTDTLFDGCEMVKSMFTHSNFKDACFHMCYVDRLHLTSCCIENTDMDSTDESGFDLSNAYQTLEEYEESNNPVIKMGEM